MQQFNAAFRNELTRVFRKRKTVAFCLINIAVIVLYALFQNLSRISFASGVLGSMGNLHGLFFMVVFPLYVFAETMDVFSGEMANLTIRNALIRPVTRTKIYLAKVCAVCAFILVQIFFAAAFCGVFSAIMGDGAATVAKNAAAFAVTFVPMAAFAFLAAFVTQIVKKGLLGMLLCILFLIASYAAEALAPTVSAFLFVRHIGLYKMLLTGNIQFTGIFAALFIIAAYIGVTFTAGALLFERKEF